MSFTGVLFLLLFLPIVYFAYLLCRKSVTAQNVVLLVAGIIFYACYDVKYVLFLTYSIVVTYAFSNRGGALHLRKKWLLMGVALNLALLLIFKYASFTIGNLNLILNYFHISLTPPKLLLPVGLSFYIFQSTSYLLDVYYGKMEPEKNFLNYALFVSFFPTITSGPILRAPNMLPQIRNARRLDWNNFQKAVLMFLYGAFMKMMIADRLALFTSEVFGNYQNYRGFVLLSGACSYSIQIYADFAGYSFMAIAVALLFGFSLPENFRQPYFATSIADFWRRWHISLTSWFRDYIYIPLGGNRKGKLRKYINLTIVFLVSGLWHGAAWSFVLWGGLHASYQIIGGMTLNYRIRLCGKLGLNRTTEGYRIWQRLCVFLLTTVAWIFFNLGDAGAAFLYIKNMFMLDNIWVLLDGTMLGIGLTGLEWVICAVSILIVAVVSSMREKIKSGLILRQNFPTKAVVFLTFFFALVVFGVYGPEFSSSSFIYAGF